MMKSSFPIWMYCRIFWAKTIFSRKPNPAYVCVGFAEEEIRKDLTEMARLADRIHLEAILKDTHTVENHPEKLHRWVEIAREILG